MLVEMLTSSLTTALLACLLHCPCLAAGGVFVHAQTGCPSAAHLGIGSGALLGMAAVAMSDMRGGNPLGELGVKAAFGECGVCGLGCFSADLRSVC